MTRTEEDRSMSGMNNFQLTSNLPPEVSLIICDVPHRHPTYVGALDFELWPCFAKIIFFG